MFESLTQSLQKTFKNLRGHGKLSESNIQDALREVRLALLEADVHFEVVRKFIADVREKVLGQATLDGVNPGQQFVARVHDELVALLGGKSAEFDLSGKPAQILMLGLHGAGKTTTTGKLAMKWKNGGRRVLLVACDIRRPAAVEQLRVLGEQAGVEVLAPKPGETVPDLGMRARDFALRNGHDLVIYDTGGRFQIDDELVSELSDLKAFIQPRNTVIVLDAAIGQEAVHVAKTFHEKVGLTGMILTKLDGDARGGAALSVSSVVGCPILMIGVGEKQEDLQPFHPDRLASRILGMGDVVSLVERAQESMDENEMKRMEERLFSNQLDLNDFLAQIRQMKKLGPVNKLMDMLPGMPSIPADQREKAAEMAQRKSQKFEAVILSMTPGERRKPATIHAKRRIRIARGSGTTVKDVNDLLKQFRQTQEMAPKLKKMQKMLLRMGRGR
ncbi:MAG: signal recognition particle protein [Kiritimatiellia bacterium]